MGYCYRFIVYFCFYDNLARRGGREGHGERSFCDVTIIGSTCTVFRNRSFSPP